MTLPERAASTALTLATAGKREGGRWKRGSVPDAPNGNQDSLNSGQWNNLMSDAGLVIDLLGAARLKRVAEGREALDAAVRQAKEAQAEQRRVRDLPAALRELVEAGEMELVDAERRARLPEKYEKLVASGDLSLKDAEHLYTRTEREHAEAVERGKEYILAFLSSYSVAANLRTNGMRQDILDALEDHDRERFLTIERAIKWPTMTT